MDVTQNAREGSSARNFTITKYDMLPISPGPQSTKCPMPYNGDIKGANLLVDAHGVVKLADFRMAKHLSGHVSNLSMKGSPYWMAPEVIQSVLQKDANGDLALAIDIWSLGCTIIEMLQGKPPWSEFEGAAAMFKVLRETPPIPEILLSVGKDFPQCCFRRNPAERPSASMLLEHGFYESHISPKFQLVHGHFSFLE